ncbi:MAG: hypothetical protein AAF547_14555 [Actinomycetota bacterium]
MRQSIPRSVAVLAVLHALAALVFGALAHIEPTNQFPELVTNDDGLFAVSLYANRNIGVGLSLLVALAIGSRWALMGLFAARFVTDAADLITAFTQVDGAGAVVGQLVFFGLLFASELYVLRTLFRLETNNVNHSEVAV